MRTLLRSFCNFFFTTTLSFFSVHYFSNLHCYLIWCTKEHLNDNKKNQTYKLWHQRLTRLNSYWFDWFIIDYWTLPQELSNSNEKSNSITYFIFIMQAVVGHCRSVFKVRDITTAQLKNISNTTALIDY